MEPPKPAPRRALRKLLDRIRSQRDEWVSGSSCVSDSPTVFTDQIPEQDTSIESGSLQSEEKREQTPTEAPEGTIPPPGESFAVIMLLFYNLINVLFDFYYFKNIYCVMIVMLVGGSFLLRGKQILFISFFTLKVFYFQLLYFYFVFGSSS